MSLPSEDGGGVGQRPGEGGARSGAPTARRLRWPTKFQNWLCLVFGGPPQKHAGFFPSWFHLRKTNLKRGCSPQKKKGSSCKGIWFSFWSLQTKPSILAPNARVRMLTRFTGLITGSESGCAHCARELFKEGSLRYTQSIALYTQVKDPENRKFALEQTWPARKKGH